ncbi:Gfo/Idh/MocA family oxidoreductase [Kribbella sp. NPDC055110]
MRTAIVGTGHRAQLFTEGLAKRDAYDVVALCDPNSVRMAFHNRMLLAAGRVLRDQSVFAPGVSIEDDMAVLVSYDTGATMTYHLTAYSPVEGYRVMFNGSGGRLELSVEESTFTGIVLRPLWSAPVDHTVDHDHEGHGGADPREPAALLDGEETEGAEVADARQAALALVRGLAANRSFETGLPVRTADLLKW